MKDMSCWLFHDLKEFKFRIMRSSLDAMDKFIELFLVHIYQYGIINYDNVMTNYRSLFNELGKPQAHWLEY
jgi:hypothetical protein